MKSWLGMVSMLRGHGNLQGGPGCALNPTQRGGPRVKWGVEVTGGGVRGQGSCAARAPPVVAQVEHQHVLGILQLPGTLSQIIAAQVLGDESEHHPQSWDGSPIPQLPPTPKDHGASLGPRSRCSSVPRVSSKGTNEQDSMKTQHLPAPRGPPAGRCHQGLLSSLGCLHVPRLPSKRTERNDCSLAPATC